MENVTSQDIVEKNKNRDDEIEKKMPFFRTLWPYMRTYKSWLVGALILMMISNLANLIVPLIAGEIIQFVSDGKQDSQHVSNLPIKLPFVSSMQAAIYFIIVLFLIQAISTYFRGWFIGRFGEGFVRDLRIAIHNHLIRMPIMFFDKSKSGDIASRVTNDVTAIQSLVTSNVMRILGGFTELVGASILMVYIHPWLALISFSLLPILVLISKFFGQKIKRAAKGLQDKIGTINSRVTEISASMRVVRAFGNLEYEEQVFSKEANASFKFAMSKALSNAAFLTWTTMAVNTTIIIIFGTGFMLASSGELSHGEFFVFLLLAVRVMIPLFSMANFFTEVQAAKAAAIRINEVMIIPTEEVNNVGSSKVSSESSNLEAKNLYFSYDDNEVLKNINLTIEAGKSIALVGPSGAGKTTLAGMFIKLFSPNKGEILIDGVSYQDIDLVTFRKIIAYVPQDPVLYDGTIMDNVRYGRLTATDDEILSVMESANALEFVEQLPDGASTIVGERGVKLSGGERQRIAIARALLRNPRILVLDEATSSLDAISERKVQTAIERLLSGRTAIIVAHRLSTIRNVDTIIVLKKGEIVEQGNHETLIANNGTYAKLYELQVKEEEILRLQMFS